MYISSSIFHHIWFLALYSMGPSKCFCINIVFLRLGWVAYKGLRNFWRIGVGIRRKGRRADQGWTVFVVALQSCISSRGTEIDSLQITCGRTPVPTFKLISLCVMAYGHFHPCVAGVQNHLDQCMLWGRVHVEGMYPPQGIQLIYL